MPDAFFAVIAVGLHNGESILISRMWLSHRNTPCAEYPQPICVLGNVSSIGTGRVRNAGFCQRDLRSELIFYYRPYAGQALFRESQPGRAYCGRVPVGD